MSFSYSPKIVTDGLVLYLDAANTRSYPGTGTVWTDLSRSGNNGTLTNGPTFNSSNNGSIVFDGTNDYINMNNVNFGNTYTISLLVRLNDLNSRVWVGGIDTTEYHMNFQSGNMVNRVNNNLITFSTNVTTNIWYNISLVRNNTTLTCYKNGNLVSSTTIAGATTNFVLYRIGSSPSGFYGNGNISNILIYNRALSATEVLQNYNTTKSRFGL